LKKQLNSHTGRTRQDVHSPKQLHLSDNLSIGTYYTDKLISLVLNQHSQSPRLIQVEHISTQASVLERIVNLYFKS